MVDVAHTATVERLPVHLSYLQPAVYDDMVRVGGLHDGGYVISRARLTSAAALVSFGVSTDWAFEKQLLEMVPNLLIHAYDHTVDYKLFAKYTADAVIGSFTGRAGVGDVMSRLRTWREYYRFFSGRVHHYRERVCHTRDKDNDATIHAIFQRLGETSNLIVKCDIEGGEYEVISDLLAYADRVDVILIEFHATDRLRASFERHVRSISEQYCLAHLHGNNYSGRDPDGLPIVLEATFIHKRFGVPPALRERLPVPGLDSPCNAAEPELALSFESTSRCANDAGKAHVDRDQEKRGDGCAASATSS